MVPPADADSGLKCMVEEEKGRIRRWMNEDMVYALRRPRKRRVTWVVGFSLVVVVRLIESGMY